MADSSAATGRLWEDYSAVLEKLSASAYDRALHEHHLRLTAELALEAETDAARDLYAERFSIEPRVWLEWIKAKKARVANAPADDLTQLLELMEIYERAIQDFVSIELLVSYSNFYIHNYYKSQGLSIPNLTAGDDEDEPMEEISRQVGEPDLILGTAFGLEQLRRAREQALQIGGRHLADSAKLFRLWSAFELDLLSLTTTPEQVAEVDKLFLARLAVPHLNHEATFASYSHFVTKYDNESYSTKLPAANKIYSPAKAIVDEREAQEAKLARREFVDWAFAAYVDWELEVKRPRVPAVHSLYQRATAQHPRSVELWEGYIRFASASLKARALEICERAIKALPESAQLWAAYLRAAEKAQQSTEQLAALFERAIGTGLFEKDVEALVLLYEAGAGFWRRAVGQLPKGVEADEKIQPAVDLLEQGIAKVNATQKKGPGDAQLRLEKHLISIYEHYDQLEQASHLWETLTKAVPTSYAVWYGHADFEARRGHLSTAHDVYAKGCAARSLDYVEYLLGAWLSFEKQSGSLAGLELAMTKVDAQRKVNERRAAAQANAHAEVSVAPPVEEVVPSTKRERSPALEKDSAKKPKVDQAPAAQQTPAVAAPVAPRASHDDGPKRDREHSTVFLVAPAASGLTEDLVRDLFKECGEMRECKLKQIGPQSVALVEFAEIDDVLAARTRDKKRINGEEVDVHVAHGSTLYATNFPESYDKEKVEELFGPFGIIFDTRWPSKRFKNTRRFCYIQFVQADHAQAALSLNGRELEPGHKLSVAVSDPSRKQNRSDHAAHERELYIAGLARGVKEDDLRQLFDPFGTIKAIRVPVNEKGDAKGFAFVEFEAEQAAQKGLTVNNFELKRKRISVTIAQPRQVGTQRPTDGPKEAKDILAGRRLFVKGFKAGTEEAIVQQALEKLAKVDQVLMDVGATEATVLFENAAEMGKALLAASLVQIDGEPVELLSRAPRGADRRPSGAVEAPMVPRSAARGRGRGRIGLGAGRGGRGRGALGLGAGASVSSQAPPAASTQAAGGKGQDFFRSLIAKKE